MLGKCLEASLVLWDLACLLRLSWVRALTVASSSRLHTEEGSPEHDITTHIPVSLYDMAAASFLGPVVALALLLLTVTLGRYDPRKPNPRHPRKVPAVIPIPFIGHMLGIFIYRNHYYTMIRSAVHTHASFSWQSESH